jgi:hypothetical protein
MPRKSEPRVYPSPGGVWYYDLRLPDGARERRWAGLSREEAIEAARRRLRELRGEPEPDAPPPVVRTAPGSNRD